MITDYLDQLEAAARAADVDLAAACKAEGVAATTLARWRKGEISPRKATAEAVASRIASMKLERPAA